jgi:hypothetical protein
MFVSGVKDIPSALLAGYQVNEAMVVFGPVHLARISIVKSDSSLVRGQAG